MANGRRRAGEGREEITGRSGRPWEEGIYPRLPRTDPPDFEEPPPARVLPAANWPAPEPDKVKRLLDDVDNNIGRMSLVLANRPAAIGVAGRGEQVLLCRLRGSSRFGQVVTVVFAAYDPRNYAQGSESGADLAAEPGLPVGIVRFGNGSGLAEVEVDIPNPNSHANGSPNSVSGTAISVPAGNLEIYARDDGRQIPSVGSVPFVADADTGGQLVSAHVVYGDRGSPGKVYRSIPFSFNGNGLDTGLVVGGTVTMTVPPFARSIQFIRNPRSRIIAVPQMGWTAAGGPFNLDEFDCPANEDSPVFPVPPRCTQFLVINQSGSDLAYATAIFEIAL